MAFENATFHERDLEWARVQQDLDAARAIQRSLLPKAMPTSPTSPSPAAPRPATRWAATISTPSCCPTGRTSWWSPTWPARGSLRPSSRPAFAPSMRSLVTQPLALADIVARVGQQHWEEGTEARRRYVTAIFARLRRSPKARSKSSTPATIPGRSSCPTARVRMIDASGTPLGMLPGMSYSAETFPFAPGSRILLYTDGLTEVFCGEDEFGSERLTEEFRTTCPRQSAEHILEYALGTALAAFSSERTRPMT